MHSYRLHTLILSYLKHPKQAVSKLSHCYKGGVHEECTRVVDDDNVEVAVVAALHAAQEVAACVQSMLSTFRYTTHDCRQSLRPNTARERTNPAEAVDSHIQLLALALSHLLGADSALRN